MRRAGACGSDVDGRALGAVVDGVFDQVAQHVVELGGIAVDDGRIAGDGRRASRCPLRASAGLHVVSTLRDEIRDVDRHALERFLPASRRASRSRSWTSRSMRAYGASMISRNRRALVGVVGSSSSAST